MKSDLVIGSPRSVVLIVWLVGVFVWYFEEV